MKRVAKGVGLGYADGEDQEEEEKKEEGRLGATVRMTVDALRYGYKSSVIVPSPGTDSD